MARPNARRTAGSRRLPTLLLFIAVAAMAWLLRPEARDPQPDPSTAPAAALSPQAATAPDGAAVLPAFLPAEAGPVIRRIQAGGSFPHRQDGSVFGNREQRLPRRGHGWYREYTVPTPGLDHRGARRIVTGGDPPGEWYYTADHYRSFRAFEPPATRVAR